MPSNFCKDVFVEYSFYRDDKKRMTPVIRGKERSPVFNFSEFHKDCMVTDQMLDYLLKSTLCFKVFGLRDTKVKRKKKQPAIVEQPSIVEP